MVGMYWGPDYGPILGAHRINVGKQHFREGALVGLEGVGSWHPPMKTKSNMNLGEHTIYDNNSNNVHGS